MAAAARRVDPVRRILVVDDDEQLCELVTDILEDAGYEAHCIHNDRGAFSALSGVMAYAALVVDVNLGPGVTGFDVARFARQMRPTLPVLYVSGDSSEASFRAFGVPGSAFVEKPFPADELVRRLRLITGDNEA
ncbi:FOG: CheY-like receiver [Phenylobacterium zucineum HLK1]|uniref:FOG: CheY-like receiver n=1 Tax=Phenylobacterium zucineum (strain HLK1) TaxID=450851 RepID=B4RH83_PHEZH|nr:response regulator [Phenylobacterium zucineum]ACG79031.1 FOG: CheY-like receiver [Phenylobacterium zucineum HLK1]